ncbi:PsbP-related protein [Ascidiimonas aurantiaca]|uniref:PsbP-related protein n=1 Tax=Ascidiimonas aurantiaca TaxID=1685432 RepID=UPI0030EC6209
MRVIFLQFLLFFTCFSCQSQLSTIELDRKEFNVSYPESFVLDESGQNNTVFVLKTKAENANDTFIENINLATQPITNSSFDDFVSKTISEISAVGKLIEKKKLNVDGLDCLKLKFVLTQNNIPLTFVQHYYIKNGKVYVLTLSSESSKYEKYLNLFEVVLSTFTLK